MNISLKHFTQYPNLAFHKIRQYIKDGALNEIDISVYFLVLDQYNRVASICKNSKQQIQNVSVSIQSISKGLNISKTYAAERLKALNDVGLIFRVKVEDSFNGNKNTRPAIYIVGKTVTDNSHDYTPPNKTNINAPNKAAANLKTTDTADYDNVPF